jgi:UDP-N-acetylglucosamine:LPS N-acetylglucosamine transferase
VTGRKKDKKVMFISSTGGHLNELLQLKNIFNNYEFNLITERTKSTLYLRDTYKGKVFYMTYGTKDHMLTYPFKLFWNCIKSVFYYFKLHPDYIVTTGVHTAGPMCCLGKIFGSKIIYIETFANSKTKSATGSIVYKFADLFIVQWESMLELYPKGTYGGWIF